MTFSNTDVSAFLQAVFPDHVSHAIFSDLVPGGGMHHTRRLESLDGTRDCYWSIAAFPDDGLATRRADRALEVRAFVVDDVGTKVPEGAVRLALGEPTAIIESSAGNYQFTYRLSEPVAVADWRAFALELERMIGHKLDAGATDPVHVFRLPFGTNTKPGRGLFNVKLLTCDNAAELDVRQVPYGPVANSIGTVPGGPVGSLSPTPSGPRVHDIQRLVALIPNDVLYDEWIAIGQRIVSLALDQEAAREAFHEFSARSTVRPQDPATTEQKWRTLKPDRTSGLVLLEMAAAADPEGYRAFWNAEAGHSFDDGEVEPDPDARAKLAAAARPRFELGEKKQILTTMRNAEIAIVGLGIKCTYDAFHHRIYVEQRGGVPERLADDLVLMLRGTLKDAWGKDFGPVHVGDAVRHLALKNAFNPVTDMLAAAQAAWDGVKRLDRLGPDYFNSDDTPFAREAFRKVMLAAVRRARSPGVKFDQILVTESPEGWNKSTAWAVLAGPDNFSDAAILGKDARAVQEELADIWIHEIADLTGLAKAEIEHVKAFASRTNDRARPAYGRYLIDQPRQSINVGTTNANAYLLSTTGNRRFWPVQLRRPVDLAKLRADRLLLWGEAAAAEAAGETLVLSPGLWAVAADEQEQRRVIDTWEDELDNLVEMPPGAPAPTGCERIEVRGQEQFISNLSINEYLSGYRRQPLTGASGRKIAEIMQRLGWERCKQRVNGMPVRGYKRARSTHVATPVTASGPQNPF